MGRILYQGDRKVGKEREKLLLDNGAKLLEEMISFCNGRFNPIRYYSADQVKKAIDAYCKAHSLEVLIDHELKKGILDDRIVLIKRNFYSYQNAYRDIAITTQMSSHKNVLKLLGYCLEFPGPVLIYEHAENGFLDNRLSSLLWSTRLKIAKQTAHATTYLHCAFSRPIVHREIQPSTILLDHNYDAKLFDFSCSITIPEGETRVRDDILGTFGFLDPVYLTTEIVTEKSDVFSFGMLLLVLLSGKSTIFYQESGDPVSLLEYAKDLTENGLFEKLVDPTALENQVGAEQSQMRKFLDLAFRCTEFADDDRPTMTEVAKQLQVLERSVQ